MRPSRSRFVLPLLLAGPLALGAPARPDAGLESLLVALDLERRGRAEDVADLERVTVQTARAEAAAVAARARVLDLARTGDPDPETLRDEEDRVAEAEGRARVLQESRRALAVRLVERGRRIAFLSEEIARRRSARAPADPVTGRWAVTIDPGGQQGVFHLVLDGTIVSGDYTLSGGFRGSLRGTFVAEKLTLQRVDAERGADANFYGKLGADRRRFAGTWQGTNLVPAIGPVAGTWSASPLPDQDDGGPPQ